MNVIKVNSISTDYKMAIQSICGHIPSYCFSNCIMEKKTRPESRQKKGGPEAEEGGASTETGKKGGKLSWKHISCHPSVSFCDMT